MSKRKAKVSEDQLSLMEVAAEKLKQVESRALPDDHPLLMAYREAYFDEWCRRYPEGYLAKYSQERVR